MKKVIREPLLHFLVLGAGLFLLDGYVHRDRSDDPQTIVVNREKLLGYVQYHLRPFDASRFDGLIGSLSDEALRRLIQDYVREEALYREAKSLQLDKYDYVSRLQLIRQLEFMTRGFSDAHAQFSEHDIQRYYDAHRTLYTVPPSVTFTHVFFSEERHGLFQAGQLARAELSKLNQNAVSFDQAPAHGERFPYGVNFVQREPEDIARHFGLEMRQKLFALEPNLRVWQGPFQSPYGYHLVLLSQLKAARVPALEEIGSRVEREARDAMLSARFEESVQKIVAAYKVRVDALQPRARERKSNKAPS